MSTILYLYPHHHLPVDLLPYALGHTNDYPNVTGIARKHIAVMTDLRRTYIRKLLHEKKQVAAHALPDFNQLMSEEIWQYAKRELRPTLFRDWESIIRETPRFSEVFYREDARLHREYKDAVDQKKSFIKAKYLTITSKRRAFARAVQDAELLGELECACLGEVRYGLP